MLNAKQLSRSSIWPHNLCMWRRPECGTLAADLAGNKYKADISEEHNILLTPNNPGYQGTIYPAKPAEEDRLEAPQTCPRVNLAVALDSGKSHCIFRLTREVVMKATAHGKTMGCYTL